MEGLDVLKEYEDRLPEACGQLRTNLYPYLNGLLTGIVMQRMWCRPGKTGTLGLLLCLFWQAQYSGVEPEWNNNINSVKQILNYIGAIPVGIYTYLLLILILTIAKGPNDEPPPLLKVLLHPSAPKPPLAAP